MNEPFIVAEIGANHCGSFELARQLVYAARDAGADGVKFQTYTPEEIAADVEIASGPWAGRSYHDLYREAAMPWTWHEPLFELARQIGLIPFSSPFSIAAIERLESIKCPIYKIASPEITYLPLIAAAARTRKPLIISTGMATFAEIYQAYETARDNGCTDLTFLHCISAYPAKTSDFNLKTMAGLLTSGFKVGLSDHSRSNIAAIAAVAMGATVIEKHFTLDRCNGSPDAKFSLTPTQFELMADDCRAAAAARGEVVFGCRPAEATSLQYRRSIWLVKDIKAGEIVTEDHLAILRPNYGASLSLWGNIVGKQATTDMASNTPMTLDCVK